MPVAPSLQVKVADEVWIATALLHREQPGRADFEIEEIMQRALREGGNRTLRPGVYVHIVQHCVANRPPNPGRYRMLFETEPGRRRLFRKGDNYHPARENAKITPAIEDVPSRYSDLFDWYGDWSQGNIEERINSDPLLALYGDGRDLWADEKADDYVRHLREGW